MHPSNHFEESVALVRHRSRERDLPLGLHTHTIHNVGMCIASTCALEENIPIQTTMSERFWVWHFSETTTNTTSVQPLTEMLWSFNDRWVLDHGQIFTGTCNSGWYFHKHSGYLRSKNIWQCQTRAGFMEQGSSFGESTLFIETNLGGSQLTTFSGTFCTCSNHHNNIYNGALPDMTETRIHPRFDGTLSGFALLKASTTISFQGFVNVCWSPIKIGLGSDSLIGAKVAPIIGYRGWQWPWGTL